MPRLRIDCSFPGGNLLVEGIDGDTVRLRQNQRDTERWWFYWQFRIRRLRPPGGPPACNAALRA